MRRKRPPRRYPKVLGYRRLTDRAEQGPAYNPQENASLPRLFDMACDVLDPQTVAELQKKLDAVNASAKIIRSHRHKRLVHKDLAVSQDSSLLPDLTPNMVRKCMDDIRQLVNAIEQALGRAPTLFEHPISEPLGDRILRILRLGLEMSELQRKARYPGLSGDEALAAIKAAK